MPGPCSGSRAALPSQVTGRADLQQGETDTNTPEDVFGSKSLTGRSQCNVCGK